MPPVLHISKGDFSTVEQRSTYSISIVGCGLKALQYALAFADAGFKIKCADPDQSVIRRISKGNIRLGNREAEIKFRQYIRSERVSATSDLKDAATSDIIVLTVDEKVDEKNCPDYSEVESVCKKIGATIPKNCLVIYCGVCSFGFTEGIIREVLENTSGLRSGEDFGLAFSPLQKLSGQTTEQSASEMLVGANDKFSMNSASTILETISSNVKKINGLRTAELISLFTAAHHDLNAAMANELADFCEKAKLDCSQIISQFDANLKKVLSLPTISEEENRKETYLLLDAAENLNIKLRLPAISRQVNEDMVKHALSLTQDALRSGGKPLRRAKVALLGSSIEPETASLAFIEMLESKGAKVSRYDPYVSESEKMNDSKSGKKTLNEAVEGTDCVVIASEQEHLKRLNLKKLIALMKSPASFVDLSGMFDPSNVEEVGFIYRGLGRGVWKK